MTLPNQRYSSPDQLCDVIETTVCSVNVLGFCRQSQVKWTLEEVQSFILPHLRSLLSFPMA